MSYENPQILPLKGDALEYKHTWEVQFENPEKIEVVGQEMKVIDLKPEKEKSEVPTIFLRGWGTTAEVYRTNLKEIARDGRRAIAIDEPAGIEVANISEKDKEKSGNIPELELRKVAALLKVVDAKKLEKIDLVGHSEGAIYGLYAAMLRPGLVRDIVLVDPAGMMTEGDSPLRVSGRAIIDLAVQIGGIYKKFISEGDVSAISKTLAGGQELLKVFYSNPEHTVGSIGAITQTEIQDVLKLVHDLGTKISIIHGVDDQMFSMENMQKNKDLGSAVDGFYSVQGTHNEMYVHPEAYTKVINSALGSLEALDKKKGAEEATLEEAAKTLD